MAAITLQNLKLLIAEAYKAGHGGALDMVDDYVDEVSTSLLSTPDQTICKNEGWTIFKIADLKQCHVGTIFEHSSRGKGWIEAGHCETYMRFHTGQISYFYEDNYPWNEPMRIIGKTMQEKAKPKKIVASW